MRTTFRRTAVSGVFLAVILLVSGAVAAVAQAAAGVVAVFGPVTGVPTTQAISSGRFSGFPAPSTGSASSASVAIGVIAGLAVLALIAYVGLALDRRARPELRAVEGPSEEAAGVAGSTLSRPAEDEEQRRRAA